MGKIVATSSGDPGQQEPVQVRPDLERVRRKLTALQIETPKPHSRISKAILPLVILIALGAVVLAYTPIGHSIRGVGNAVRVNCVRPTTQTAATTPAAAPLLNASGYVVARRQAVISAKIQGILTELDVNVGDAVTRGQVIARLQSAEYEARIENSKAGIQVAQAALDENRRQLRIAEELGRAQLVSQDQRDAARSRVDAAQASLTLAQADLRVQEVLKEDAVIRAPFSGIVVKKMAEVGESVSPIPPGVNISTSSGAIVAVADVEHLDVDVDVSEARVGKLKAGFLAEIIVQAFPEHKYRGQVHQLVPTADRTKGTVQVKVTVLDADRNLKPEMSAQVAFLQGSLAAAANSPKAVMTVPLQALAKRAGTTVLFEVVSGIVHERAVVTGESRGERVVITQGLSGQEWLVVRPPPELHEGDAVRVISTRGAE